MAWGALIGLGQGLQQVGGLLMDNNKQKLAQQLEIDKEKRKDARDKAIYDREQAEYSETRREQDDNGQWILVDYAKSGDPMPNRSRPAPANIVTEMNAKAQRDKLSLENDILQGKKMQSDLDYAPEQRELARREAESNIQYRDRTGLAASMRTDNSEKTPANFYDAVDQLIKDTSDLQQQYTKPDANGNAALTPSEYRGLVEQTIRAAAQRGLDARAVLRDALRRRTQNNGN